MAATKVARQDISEVFKVWESAHGKYDALPTSGWQPTELSNTIKALNNSEATKLALAPSYKGLMDQVLHCVALRVVDLL